MTPKTVNVWIISKLNPYIKNVEHRHILLSRLRFVEFPPRKSC